MPAKARIAPAAVISNMPNGARPPLWATPSTSRLVDVPISVVVPPKIDAKDRGISNLDGEIFNDLASRIATGINTTTTGVLLMKADRKITASIMTRIARMGGQPVVNCVTHRPA